MKPHLLLAAVLLASPVLPGVGAAETEKEKAPPAKEPDLQRLVVDPIYSLKEVDQMPVATSQDRKSTRLNSSHSQQSRMPSSA